MATLLHKSFKLTSLTEIRAVLFVEQMWGEGLWLHEYVFHLLNVMCVWSNFVVSLQVY